MDKKIIDLPKEEIGFQECIPSWLIEQLQESNLELNFTQTDDHHFDLPEVPPSINIAFIPKGFYYDVHELALYRILKRETNTELGREVNIYFLKRIEGLDYSRNNTGGRAYYEQDDICIFPEYILEEIQESMVPLAKGIMPRSPRVNYNDKIKAFYRILKEREFGTNFTEPSSLLSEQQAIMVAIIRHELTHLRLHRFNPSLNAIHEETLCFFSELQVTPYSTLADLFLLNHSGQYPSTLFLIIDYLSHFLYVPAPNLNNVDSFNDFLCQPNGLLSLSREEFEALIQQAERAYIDKLLVNNKLTRY